MKRSPYMQIIPTIYSTTFTLSWLQKNELLSGKFTSSNQCCVCGKLTKNLLPVRTARRNPFEILFDWIFQIKENNTDGYILKDIYVPQCEDHSKKTFARCIIDISYPDTNYTAISCISENIDFLMNTRELNIQGDYCPPWIAFSDSEPDRLYWKHPNQSRWLYDHWAPFWMRLSIKERKDYLEKWEFPSQEWSIFIDEVFPKEHI